jgi:hypothetical protein
VKLSGSGFCKNGNEPLGLVEGGTFLVHLSGLYRPKTDSASYLFICLVGNCCNADHSGRAV